MRLLWDVMGIVAALGLAATAVGQDTGLSLAGPTLPVGESITTSVVDASVEIDRFASLDVPTLADGDYEGGDLLPAMTVFQDTAPEPVEEIILEEDVYVGGQGLVTSQGMRGMFLSPTSGTLAQGQLTVQYCVLLFQNDGPNNTGQGLLATYGVFDWLEAGFFILYVDANAIGDHFWAGGPQVRVRAVKDGEHHPWMPEVSAGFIGIYGDDEIQRTEFDIMLSKLISIDPEGTFKGVRLHGGLRRIYFDDSVAAYANSTVFFGGVEVLLPYDLSFIFEGSTKHDYAPHTPYALGVQWRPTGVVGISVAAVEPGGVGRLSPYIGIGLNF